MSERVVAVLGRGVVPADAPILRADDLGVLRGDGVFETMNVRPVPEGGPAAGAAGTAMMPWLLDEHLARMARSAARLDLPLPDAETLAGLAAQACAAWPAGVEGALRLVCTRGPEDGGPVTVFATISPVGPAVVRARREGVSLVTASLQVPATARPDAPWLLGGVKSLSYAVNMASQRWAAAQGADDVLWVSSDGYALEAPTSTLVWLAGGMLCTVPAQETGILPGTTARHLLDRAGELGWSADERMVSPADLARADGVWLVSSVRGAAEIRSVDGVARRAAGDLTTGIANLLDFPR